MDIDLSISGGHNFVAQTKGLEKYCQWQKENYLCVMIIDRDDRDHNFIFYLHSSLLASNIGIFVDSSI